jgi:hypothetical protein
MRFRVPFAAVMASTIAACTLFSGLEGFSSPDDGRDASGADGGDGPPVTGTRKMVMTVGGTKVLEKDVFLVGPGLPNVWLGITFASKTTNSGSVVVDDALFEVLP